MARCGPTSTGSGTLPKPPPELDLSRIVEVLDRHGVEYLIVGGHAARAYGMKAMSGPDGAPRRYEDLADEARVLSYIGVKPRRRGPSPGR